MSTSTGGTGFQPVSFCTSTFTLTLALTCSLTFACVLVGLLVHVLLDVDGLSRRDAASSVNNPLGYLCTAPSFEYSEAS